MKRDDDRIFCKIVVGQIPCFKLLEDDETLSFMDIYPANDGHCLVIAKEHYPTLFDINGGGLRRSGRPQYRLLARREVHLIRTGLPYQCPHGTLTWARRNGRIAALI
jgi:HIT domain